jgi:hypothetical protein
MRKLLLVSMLSALGGLFVFDGPLTAGTGRWTVDFENSSLADWYLAVPGDWKIVESQGNHVLRLDKAGPVGAKPRRPVKFALWKPGCVGSFELDVRVRRDPILEKEGDVLVIFGFQDKLHFYYAHLSSDDGNVAVHNGLFRVNGGDRERIAGKGARPVLPDENWHRVRILRNALSGEIKLFLDNDAEPRFRVTDLTHSYGLVGVGSFDNTGQFDDLHLTGTPSGECRPDQIQTLDVP